MDLRDLDCPLRGCRAPCIAAGELDKFNERLAENARQEIVLIQQREDLTPAERAQVMDEFAVGREYIQTEFSIRLSTGWSSIPLKGLVLGHQDFEREIIPGLIACLMQFESIPPEQYAELSEVTLTLFARGGAVREQILCLIRRTHTFDQLPAVLRIRIAAAQLPVAEVSIERRHAAIHAGTRSTPNHTIQYDSVHGLRKKEITSIFEDTPEQVQALSRTFDKDARTPIKCIESLGLQAHPEIRRFVSEAGRGLTNNLPHNIAAYVIYRGDQTSQLHKFEEFPRRPPPPPESGPVFVADVFLLSLYIYIYMYISHLGKSVAYNSM